MTDIYNAVLSIFGVIGWWPIVFVFVVSFAARRGWFNLFVFRKGSSVKPKRRRGVRFSSDR